ncbi:hypothetical protein V6N12_045881 [Hibiscus sabdariffa]|uniref:Uncharacterized protein n=1 Tax=Hibiscus sabdariffa TaxID=183260 RepID=A0ABR2G480_9ROSI
MFSVVVEDQRESKKSKNDRKCYGSFDLHGGSSDVEVNFNEHVVGAGIQDHKDSNGAERKSDDKDFSTEKVVVKVVKINDNTQAGERGGSTMVSNMAEKRTKNVAYQKSNPDRHSKHAGNKGPMVADVEVISLLPDGKVVVDSHKVASTSGHHRAVHIQEKVGDGKSGSRARINSANSSRERPYEALLFPGIGFGLFLHSLGGRRRRPPLFFGYMYPFVEGRPSFSWEYSMGYFSVVVPGQLKKVRWKRMEGKMTLIAICFSAHQEVAENMVDHVRRGGSGVPTLR